MSKPLPAAALLQTHLLSPSRLPWPAPALMAWAAGWLCFAGLAHVGAAPALALALGWTVSLLLAWNCKGVWRQFIAAAGFPMSALSVGAAAGLPAWAWLVPLLPLLAAYPLRAWRDAPFFPTPGAALHGLAAIVGEPRRVLDAGCGLGHGLAELRREWPRAELQGVEWSLPLAALATLRGRKAALRAQVRRADMWAMPWRDHDLVYLFQRPESMARAWAKACAELEPGAWLVSLEFAVPDVEPWARLHGDGRRAVWIYRVEARIEPSTTARPGR